MTACVLGRRGFVGSALAARLRLAGHRVVAAPGPGCDVLYHFASPTHLDFAGAPEYHARSVLASFTTCLALCARHDIRLIWPSSALVYEARADARAFVAHKHALEALQFCYSVRALAVRLFPVYGPGEGRRAHPSPVYQWCAGARRGERPRVYGDGTQTRDFLYVDDAADALIGWGGAGPEQLEGIVDLGTGRSTSFNAVIDAIGRATGHVLEPLYEPAPPGYARAGVICRDDGLPGALGIEAGVERLLRALPDEEP